MRSLRLRLGQGLSRPLPDTLPLELSDCGQNMSDQPPGGFRRVYIEVEEDQGPLFSLRPFYQLPEVDNRATKPVELGSDQRPVATIV